MSRNIDEIWASIVAESHPNLTPNQLETLRFFAASDWCVGKETDLTDLYEKYRMLCALTDKSEISIIALS